MIHMITVIDVLSAKIAMIAFWIVIAKFVTKRIKTKSADRFLMKIHCHAGYILAVTGVLHGVFSFRVFETT